MSHFWDKFSKLLGPWDLKAIPVENLVCVHRVFFQRPTPSMEANCIRPSPHTLAHHQPPHWHLQRSLRGYVGTRSWIHLPYPQCSRGSPRDCCPCPWTQQGPRHTPLDLHRHTPGLSPRRQMTIQSHSHAPESRRPSQARPGGSHCGGACRRHNSFCLMCIICIRFHTHHT